MAEPGSWSRYLLMLSAVWVIAMLWHLYPHFKDTIRLEDGRLTEVSAYLEDRCGQKVGPAAATCLAQARETANELLRREQAKSVLLIEAPLFLYVLIYLPFSFLSRSRRS
ncbi:MAG TPA: hypothetical protein VKT70_09535 [Stellaceae bacterium]|nr:hypothetical protein [Stellaceae bacterium]